MKAAIESIRPSSTGLNIPDKTKSESKGSKRKYSDLQVDQVNQRKISSRKLEKIKDKINLSAGVKDLLDDLCQITGETKELTEVDLMLFEQLVDEYVKATLVDRANIKYFMNNNFYAQLLNWVSTSPEYHKVELRDYDLETGGKTDRLDPEYDVIPIALSKSPIALTI